MQVIIRSLCVKEIDFMVLVFSLINILYNYKRRNCVSFEFINIPCAEQRNNRITQNTIFNQLKMFQKKKEKHTQYIYIYMHKFTMDDFLNYMQFGELLNAYLDNVTRFLIKHVDNILDYKKCQHYI